MHPAEWASLGLEHPTLGREATDLITLLLGRIESVPGLSDEQRALCTDLALHATWISPSGTKARGRWPGYLRLGMASELGAFRAIAVARELMQTQRMAHDDEEWVLDLLGPRWDAWKARDEQLQAEGPTLPATGMGAL